MLRKAGLGGWALAMAALGVKIEKAKAQLQLLGMTKNQAEEVAALAHGAADPLAAIENTVAHLVAGRPVSEVLEGARRLWGGSKDVKEARGRLWALGMTDEQTEEMARLAFEAATHTPRPNCHVTLENLQHIERWLTDNIPVELVLTMARRTFGGGPK